VPVGWGRGLRLRTNMDQASFLRERGVKGHFLLFLPLECLLGFFFFFCVWAVPYLNFLSEEEE
jgi:hypothetical protein